MGPFLFKWRLVKGYGVIGALGRDNAPTLFPQKRIILGEGKSVELFWKKVFTLHFLQRDSLSRIVSLIPCEKEQLFEKMWLHPPPKKGQLYQELF